MNFTGNLKRAGNKYMLFIVKEVKERNDSGFIATLIISTQHHDTSYIK